MQKALLIAEKPSLMRDIQNAYNHCKADVPYEITFKAQVGHLVELLDPVELNEQYKNWDVNLLPIDPKNEGGWKYKVKRSVRDVYKDIETEVKSGKYDVIIHAGDPDQEGEVLVNLVLEKIGNTLPVKRLWSNDTTQVALENALKNLQDDSEERFRNLYAAGILRQHTDWLFGMNGSRVIADRIYAGRDHKIAAGRVMTWIQTAIVDREDEITNFVPKTSYGVKVKFDNQLEGLLYEAVTEAEAEKAKDENVGVVYFNTITEAEDVVKNLSHSGVVADVTKTKMTEYAPKLYKLATIQMDAAKEGYSANQTLEIIQSLYEKHYVSYPRTDCEVLSSNENFAGIINATAAISAFDDARNLALTEYPRIKGMKKYVDDKELKKHGHSALVPTTSKPDLATLTDDEKTIYTLIVRRFLAIFQPPLVQEKCVVLTQIDNKTFRSSGKTILDEGYTKFLGTKLQDTTIPSVSKGDTLNVSATEITEKTTTCPKRFTDSTLIAAMENPAKYLTDKTIKDDIDHLSIGTSATRGAVIEKLIADKYIERKKGCFYPTDFGAFMIHTIRGISLCRIDTTGYWEQILTKVREGEMSFAEAESYMSEQVIALINDVKCINKTSYGVATPLRESIMVCPGCGGQGEIIESKVNYFCSAFKSAKNEKGELVGCKYSVYKELLGAKITKEDVKTLFNGGTIEKVLTKKDKSATWKQKLKFNPTEGKLDFVQAVEESTNCICPGCGANLYKQGIKITCKGCDFTAWAKMAQKELTDKELEQIFNNGITKFAVNGLVSSKTNKTFSAKIALKKNGSQSTFEFKF